MPEFDSVDNGILTRRAEVFNKAQGPRVGDFLRLPDGFLRFTHDWGDTIQTTVRRGHPCDGDASFYLGEDGYVSFSGSLDSGIDKTSLRDTGETRDGSFWFFHHDWRTAHNGVNFKIPCRVFEMIVVDDHSEPTYKNQLWMARRMRDEKGIEALDNPHGMIGRSCKCGTCFCCAAAEVVRDTNS